MQVAPITQYTAPLSRAVAERVVALERGAVPQDVWQLSLIHISEPTRPY